MENEEKNINNYREEIDIHPYNEKILYITLDESKRGIYWFSKQGRMNKFQGSMSYWIDYFNQRGCKLEKAQRGLAVNMNKITGYGWDNAVFGPWWIEIGSIKLEISKRFYSYLNKSEYRHLNKSVKLKTLPSLR